MLGNATFHLENAQIYILNLEGRSSNNPLDNGYKIVTVRLVLPMLNLLVGPT